MLCVNDPVHVTAIRSPLEFDICRGSVSKLGKSEPYISPVLAPSAEERAILVVDAKPIVSKVVVTKAVRL